MKGVFCRILYASNAKTNHERRQVYRTTVVCSDVISSKSHALCKASQYHIAARATTSLPHDTETLHRK